MIRLKKSLGQNFLIDRNILKIISEVTSIKDKIVLEIGPGTGNLTSFILKKKPKKFIVIEKDNDLASNIAEIFKDQLNIINDDVLNVDENSLASEKITVFGNLPYNISVPFIISLIEKEQPVKWEKLTLTVQKEVADRMMAKINTKQYGRLSVLTQWRCKIVKICEIKPTCFIPPPKVLSSVISIEPKNDVKTPLVKNFQKIVSYAFGFRRKTLKKSLSNLDVDINQLADLCGIDLGLRAQNLSIDDFSNLAVGYEKLSKQIIS